ncbi:MAG: hypothetical protein CVT97_07145 [Bacteroidetes bacterium HGW-Bacteroidetes-14]|jgi:hypothetical protein|nr:MAG: hypothetical protein CVT97_07145 [Bacteroidetes bacterium HGW-Bacteroidetes-14]
MSGFNFKQYITRVVKYMIYLAIVFFIIIGIFALTTQSGFKFENLFRPGTGGQMIVFFVVISLIYPFFGFVKKKVYLNKGFADDREKILEIFVHSRYILIGETSTSLTFRHTSAVVRLMRMYEDDITVDFTDNPITLEGQRKDVYRIARAIEWQIRDDRKDD